jgi:hypothetical protein
MKTPAFHCSQTLIAPAGVSIGPAALIRRATPLHRVLRLLITFWLAHSTGEVRAHHSHANELAGTVERIDRKKHLLLVRPDAHGEPLLLQWGRWTTFVKSGQVVSPEALSTGHAEIQYHVPFFGKPTLEKIILPENVATPVHHAVSPSR